MNGWLLLVLVMSGSSASIQSLGTYSDQQTCLKVKDAVDSLLFTVTDGKSVCVNIGKDIRDETGNSMRNSVRN